jgi:hypothetical protein
MSATTFWEPLFAQRSTADPSVHSLTARDQLFDGPDKAVNDTNEDEKPISATKSPTSASTILSIVRPDSVLCHEPQKHKILASRRHKTGSPSRDLTNLEE